MPIYEYQCEYCGHQLETIQKMSDQPLTDCPSCHKQGLHKLVSAGGFQLKGTGWYVTDFRNKGKKETKTESQAGKDNSTSTDTTTKTKEDKGSSSTTSSTT